MAQPRLAQQIAAIGWRAKGEDRSTPTNIAELSTSTSPCGLLARWGLRLENYAKLPAFVIRSFIANPTLIV